MSGVIVIRALLIADSGVTALAAAAQIVAGTIPQKKALPALGITEVAGFDRNILAPGAVVHVTERIQVTAVTQTFAELGPLLKAVRKACRDKIGTFAGVPNVVVHTDGKGPYFNNPDSGLHMQSQDFKVEFDEAT